MKHKTRAIVALLCVFFLLGVIVARIEARLYSDRSLESQNQHIEDCLTGAELRGMMNEAKYSPGLASAYIEKHPDFAWLFDGSFIDYISD